MPSLSYYMFTLAATCAIAPLSGVSALSLNMLSSRAESGINCDGSSQCREHRGALDDILGRVNRIEVGTVFQHGQQIACTGYTGAGGDGVCASVGENTETLTVDAAANGQMNSVGAIIEDLLYHGCTACGTAPTNREGNKLSDGSISVNYVQHVCAAADNSSPCSP